MTVAEFLMDWLPKQCSKHKWSPKTYCNAIQRPTSSDMDNTNRAPIAHKTKKPGNLSIHSFHDRHSQTVIPAH